MIGKTLYETEVKIELLDHEKEEAMEHIILRLHFSNLAFNKRPNDTRREDLIRQNIKVSHHPAPLPGFGSRPTPYSLSAADASLSFRSHHRFDVQPKP